MKKVAVFVFIGILCFCRGHGFRRSSILRSLFLGLCLQYFLSSRELLLQRSSALIVFPTLENQLPPAEDVDETPDNSDGKLHSKQGLCITKLEILIFGVIHLRGIQSGVYDVVTMRYIVACENQVHVWLAMKENW